MVVKLVSVKSEFLSVNCLYGEIVLENRLPIGVKNC